MGFTVYLSRRASKTLNRLPKQIRERILNRLRELEANPFPGDVARVRGLEDAYRIRVGGHRVLYRILWEEGVILVFRITPRREAYER
jgi:mRNA interferase RelE/StbE